MGSSETSTVVSRMTAQIQPPRGHPVPGGQVGGWGRAGPSGGAVGEKQLPPRKGQRRGKGGSSFDIRWQGGGHLITKHTLTLGHREEGVGTVMIPNSNRNSVPSG